MAYITVCHVKKNFTVRKKKIRPAGSSAVAASALNPAGTVGFWQRLRSSRQIIQALDDLSFSIEAGELIGCIGPNGAGKSTTVKILSGILVPDSGTVLVNGRVPWLERRTHVAEIGVVFGQRTQLWWDVPVIDSYRLLRDIYRLDKQTYQNRLDELTDHLQLGDLLGMPLRLLSLGQRMRCELAGSLLHSPRLLFLDEPTIGLDAVSKLAVRAFLQQENQNHGTTVLLTTHDMTDVEALCNRVLVIGHGHLLYDGRLPDLLSRYQSADSQDKAPLLDEQIAAMYAEMAL
ncbi:MAG: ATP-binding cassette domain-containing protein [Clostridiaceae bacterium]|nr:ATP-binding cassette domain-containing protein [Clostridiaceae bacterium]